MKELYQARPSTRLVDVAIPATHQSATGKMDVQSTVEPGAPKAFYIVKPIVASWAKTQFLSISQQLHYGIRFFDFRVGYDNRGVPILYHGLSAAKLIDVLNEIANFSDQHPMEIIFLTYAVSWFYTTTLTPSESENAAKKTDSIIQGFFENRGKISPISSNSTFGDFWSQNRSITILKSEDYLNHWPNAATLNEVIEYLDQASSQRTALHPDRFSLNSIIYTPPTHVQFFLDFRNIFLPSPNQNALSMFSKDLRQNTLAIIANWKAKGYKINFVSSDFIEKIQFVGAVLALNGGTYTTPVSYQDLIFP